MAHRRQVTVTSEATHNGILVDRLKRTYNRGDRGAIMALDGVSFAVRPGEIVGMLGPNGAGKTTCVRILCTLLLPTSGRAVVAGADVTEDARSVRRRCGVSLGGELGLYTRLSARDNLRYFATMYRLDTGAARLRVDEVLEQVGLSDRARDRVETFSRGMRQRLHIARAVLHNPSVLLLDEPSSGLDPESAYELRALVSDLAATSRAILLTTHDLLEAEALCARIVLLRNGTIVREASPAALRAEAAATVGTCVEVTEVTTVDDRAIAAIPGLLRYERAGRGLRVFTTDAPGAARYILDTLAGVDTSLQVTHPSLEDAYLNLVRQGRE